jgi:hypothetical protein
MKKKIITMTTLFVITALLIAAMPASAADSEIFGFEPCERPLSQAAEIGKRQFRVEVTDEGFNEATGFNNVSFKFINLDVGEETKGSAIAAVYFWDGLLLGDAILYESYGIVSFAEGATPGHPPGCVPGSTQIFYAADADNPPPDYRINPGEWLKITFDLQDDKGFGEVIADLKSGDLKIGVHGRSFEVTDGEDSLGFILDDPTAITLASFTCQANRQEVSVYWSTGTELNNAGFNLYRSETPTVPSVKINAKLLAAKAEAVSGADYRFNDAPGYGTFYYWLEDVELSGRTMLHGPISVTIKAPYRAPMFRPALPGSG